MWEWETRESKLWQGHAGADQLPRGTGMKPTKLWYEESSKKFFRKNAYDTRWKLGAIQERNWA